MPVVRLVIGQGPYHPYTLDNRNFYDANSVAQNHNVVHAYGGNDRQMLNRTEGGAMQAEPFGPSLDYPHGNDNCLPVPTAHRGTLLTDADRQYYLDNLKQISLNFVREGGTFVVPYTPNNKKANIGTLNAKGDSWAQSGQDFLTDLTELLEKTPETSHNPDAAFRHYRRDLNALENEMRRRQRQHEIDQARGAAPAKSVERQHRDQVDQHQDQRRYRDEDDKRHREMGHKEKSSHRRISSGRRQDRYENLSLERAEPRQSVERGPSDPDRPYTPVKRRSGPRYYNDNIYDQSQYRNAHYYSPNSHEKSFVRHSNSDLYYDAAYRSPPLSEPQLRNRNDSNERRHRHHRSNSDERRYDRPELLLSPPPPPPRDHNQARTPSTPRREELPPLKYKKADSIVWDGYVRIQVGDEATAQNIRDINIWRKHIEKEFGIPTHNPDKREYNNCFYVSCSDFLIMKNSGKVNIASVYPDRRSQDKELQRIEYLANKQTTKQYELYM